MKIFSSLYGIAGRLRALSRSPPDRYRSARRTLLLLLVLAAPALPAETRYGPGASDTEIRIGHTNPYTGRAAAYSAIGRAIGAYFDQLNAAGGINGRRVVLLSRDDGYQPARAKEQVRRLVEHDRVLAVFQSLGTPGNRAVQRYLNDRGVPHLFLASASSRWDQPRRFPWTIGWAPDYRTEGEVYARYILQTVAQPRIAVLAPANDIGDDYLAGLRGGLGADAGRLIVAVERYATSDPSVNAAMIALKSSGADVLVDLALPQWAAQAIRQSAALDWRPLHILATISNSIASVLRPAGLELATGLVSAQFLKDPNDPRFADDPGVLRWRQWLREHHRDGDPHSNFTVYGYTVAQTLEQVLRQCGDDLTRENLMRQATALRGLQLDMLQPGITITTGPDDYRPIEALQLVRFDGEVWAPLGEVIDLSR